MADTNLFDDWASGVSLANPVPQDNEFFQEIPLEFNRPENFQVKPEDLPPNPVEKIETPAPVVAVPEEPNQEIIQLDNGGTVVIEKTSRGWKATLDMAEAGIPTENFYGNNKTQLIANLAKAKLEASKAIRKLKKDKLLGSDEPVRPATTPAPVKPIITNAELTADDVMEIKAKLSDNPIEAIETWMKKRFGKDPEQLAQALNVAEEARNIVDAQRVKAEVDDVNAEFIRNNQDWADDYADDSENARKLIARMSKAYLNKRVTLNTPQASVDAIIYELYSKGYWTAENLETAKEDLIEIGELHKPSVTHRSPEPKPQPVAETKGPSVPEQPRIAAPTGQPAVSLGLPAKNSTPVSSPEEKTLTDVDLQSMSLTDLRQIAAAQLEQMRRGRQ